MVKTIISIIAVVCLLVTFSVYEQLFVSKQFDEFHGVLQTLYVKIEDTTASSDDVYAVQKNWLDKKRFLHAFIPHNEIKEIDLWLSEAVTLVGNKKWEDALSKIEVLIELSEQIPKTFLLTVENIF
jgi:hypothetical protein